jgi:hypothetical protein
LLCFAEDHRDEKSRVRPFLLPLSALFTNCERTARQLGSRV